MARSNIPMVINLRQNTNDDSTAFGKYFAEVDAKEPLNLKGLAKHMTEHGKISSEEMCNESLSLPSPFSSPGLLSLFISSSKYTAALCWFLIDNSKSRLDLRICLYSILQSYIKTDISSFELVNNDIPSVFHNYLFPMRRALTNIIIIP